MSLLTTKVRFNLTPVSRLLTGINRASDGCYFSLCKEIVFFLQTHTSVIAVEIYGSRKF